MTQEDNDHFEVQSGADLLRKVKPQRRKGKTQLCLRPDLLDLWEKLTDELNEMLQQESPTARLAGGNQPSKEQKAKAREIQKVEAEITESSPWFHMQSMNKDAWASLVADHGPRKDNLMDAYAGYNRDAVLEAALRACLVSPVFEDCTVQGCEHENCYTWQYLEKFLNPSEWSELRRLAEEVNGAVTESPKSEQASRILARRSSGSPRPAAGE